MQKAFLGNEQMRVDDKGRVGIPSRFVAVLRELCPDRCDSVGVMITPDRSIKIMPAPVFEKELERWSELNDQIDEERTVLNMSTSLADELALDRQNRIRLNPLMMDLCRIERHVVFVGTVHYMQLFDDKVYRAMVERQLPQWAQAATRVARKGGEGPAATPGPPPSAGGSPS